MNAPQWMGDDTRDELGTKPCDECDGDGLCPACHAGRTHDCATCGWCEGWGQCSACGGTGEAH